MPRSTARRSAIKACRKLAHAKKTPSTIKMEAIKLMLRLAADEEEGRTLEESGFGPTPKTPTAPAAPRIKPDTPASALQQLLDKAKTPQSELAPEEEE